MSLSPPNTKSVLSCSSLALSLMLARASAKALGAPALTAWTSSVSVSARSTAVYAPALITQSGSRKKLRSGRHQCRPDPALQRPALARDVGQWRLIQPARYTALKVGKLAGPDRAVHLEPVSRMRIKTGRRQLPVQPKVVLPHLWGQVSAFLSQLSPRAR